jgi:hypothetical protein
MTHSITIPCRESQRKWSAHVREGSLNEIARAIGVLDFRPSHRISLGVWFDLEPRRNNGDERSVSIIVGRAMDSAQVTIENTK